MKTLKALTLVGALAAGSSVMANTITPDFAGFVPGVSITYTADHTSAEIHAGDGFTIFDIAGFTGAVVAPAGWAFAGAAPFGSPWGVGPSGPDSTLPNLTFVYTGASVENLGGFSFGPFVIGTIATDLVVDDWTSRDHLIGTIGIIDGGVANPHTDEIVVPALPDGGATAMLLGLGVLGLGAFRRKA